MLTGAVIVPTFRSIILLDDDVPHINRTGLATVPKRLVMARFGTSIRDVPVLRIMGRSIYWAWGVREASTGIT